MKRPVFDDFEPLRVAASSLEWRPFSRKQPRDCGQGLRPVPRREIVAGMRHRFSARRNSVRGSVRDAFAPSISRRVRGSSRCLDPAGNLNRDNERHEKHRDCSNSREHSFGRVRRSSLCAGSCGIFREETTDKESRVTKRTSSPAARARGEVGLTSARRGVCPSFGASELLLVISWMKFEGQLWWVSSRLVFLFRAGICQYSCAFGLPLNERRKGDSRVLVGEDSFHLSLDIWLRQLIIALLTHCVLVNS